MPAHLKKYIMWYPSGKIANKEDPDYARADQNAKEHTDYYYPSLSTFYNINKLLEEGKWKMEVVVEKVEAGNGRAGTMLRYVSKVTPVGAKVNEEDDPDHDSDEADNVDEMSVMVSSSSNNNDQACHDPENAPTKTFDHFKLRF